MKVNKLVVAPAVWVGMAVLSIFAGRPTEAVIFACTASIHAAISQNKETR